MSPPPALHERNRNFRWSLRPILMWMRVTGIDLCPSNNVANYYPSLLLGAMMVVFTIICRVYQLVDVIEYIAETKTYIQSGENGTDVNSVTYTQIVNHVLMQFQAIVAAIGINTTMFIVFIFRWKSLWKCLDQLERDSFPASLLYSKIRRVSLIGVLFLAGVRCPHVLISSI